MATRRNIERFADVILSSSPRQRDFWLGKLPKFPAAYIEETYRFLKPCLHGSDAHDSDGVGAPALDRQCWIKGDRPPAGFNRRALSTGPTPPRRAPLGIEVAPTDRSPRERPLRRRRIPSSRS